MNLEIRLAALEQQQALIQARQDIWQTIARYACGIDEQRDADLTEIFTDQHPRRFITNHQLSVHDDGTATGYVNWFVVQSREEQPYCGWGSYDWEFRYEDGLWKISRMLITLDCMTTLERGWGMLAERILPFPPRPRP